MKYLLKKDTKCLIIQSEFSEFSFWNYVDVCKIVGAKYPAAPLGLLTVAALLPQQWTFKLVDANIEPVLDEHFQWADIICVGGMLPQQSSMLALINRAHQFGLPVVVGGPDPTSQPELYQSADFLVLGEGEVSIPMLIEDLEKGSTSGIYQSDEKADMSQAVVPRFDLIQFKDYLQIGIQYSRGCPFHCEFCNIVELFGRIPRTKTSEQMILELQTLYDLGYRGHVDIVDDNFIGNKTNVKKVLAAVKEWAEQIHYPFYFSTECSINLAEDESLLQMMSDIDFRYVFIGIETPETNALIMTKKTANVNKSVQAAIQKINSHGIVAAAGFIIGFDHESDRIAENMIRCIQDSGIAMAMLGMLYALPSTQLSRRLIQEGRLFENSSKLGTNEIVIDQTTSGLNFITDRPRVDILKDFLHIERVIYSPKNYFERVISTALQLKRKSKHKLGVIQNFKMGVSFFKLNYRLAKNPSIARHYYRMLIKVLFRNPKAIEPAVSLAAMFVHFYKQSQFIMKHIIHEIEAIDRQREREIRLKYDYTPENKVMETSV